MEKLSTEEILKTLGIEGVETIDQFREKVSETFVSRKLALEDDEIKSKVTGRITGSITTALKKAYELDSKDIEGKKVEEILAIGLQKSSGRVKSLEEELTKTRDEVVVDLQAKAEKYKNEFVQYKTQAETLQQALQERELNFLNEKKGWVINQKFQETFKEVQSDFAEEALKDSLKLKGFNSLIAEKYKFDLDDDGNFSAFDKDGKRIENKSKVGAFMTPKEVLIKEATENKMLKMSQKPDVKPNLLEGAFKPKATEKETVALHPNTVRFAKK
jgi:hypothetical protein